MRKRRERRSKHQAAARARERVPPSSLSFHGRPTIPSSQATYRLIGTGAATPLPAGAESDFLTSLGSTGGSLNVNALSILRAAPAYVALKTSSSRRRLLANGTELKGTPLTNTVDVLIQANAGSEAGVQSVYDGLRAAAYSGSLQGGLCAAGWPWAVVLRGAGATKPGDPWPEPDDWCRNRLGSACLDGSGLSGPGAKGLISAGVILVLLGTSLALVARDRKRAARGGGRMSAMLTGSVPGGVAGVAPTGEAPSPVVGAVASVSVSGGEKKGTGAV